MKNKLILTFLPFLMVISSGCNWSLKSKNKEEDALNSVLEYDYSSFDILVTTSRDGKELKSTYKVNKADSGYLLNYEIQKFNTIDLNSGELPEEMISTQTGSKQVSDAKYNLGSLKFASNTFSSYSFGDGSFTGKMSDAKSYLNTSYSCLNFIIYVKFTDKLSEIKMNYSLVDSTRCEININNFIS